jgi:CheY-like chemotaxis protein
MAKILIVDDDVGCRKAIRTFLESLHHLVAEAGNGIEALRSHQVFVPEIVLLDMLMPEMDGIETLRKLRTLDPTLPIVVLSDGGRKKFWTNYPSHALAGGLRCPAQAIWHQGHHRHS